MTVESDILKVLKDHRHEELHQDSVIRELFQLHSDELPYKIETVFRTLRSMASSPIPQIKSCGNGFYRFKRLEDEKSSKLDEWIQ